MTQFLSSSRFLFHIDIKKRRRLFVFRINQSLYPVSHKIFTVLKEVSLFIYTIMNIIIMFNFCWTNCNIWDYITFRNIPKTLTFGSKLRKNKCSEWSVQSIIGFITSFLRLHPLPLTRHQRLMDLSLIKYQMVTRLIFPLIWNKKLHSYTRGVIRKII